MQVVQQGALPLNMPQSPAKHDCVQLMQRAQPSLLAHQQTPVASSAMSEHSRPHMRIHDMLANARGVTKSPVHMSTSQQISRLSANGLSQQNIVTSAADCTRAVVPSGSTAGWLAQASDAMQMEAQPLSLSPDPEQHNIHISRPGQHLAASCSSLQLAATTAADEDAVPPHTAAAMSQANAALGQSRQLAEATAAAATTSSAAAAVPVSSGVATAPELAVLSVDRGDAAAADRGTPSLGRTAGMDVQFALLNKLDAAPADSVRASSAADQPAPVQTRKSSATDERAIARHEDLPVCHAAKEPCSTADDACAKASAPLLAAHPNSFLEDDAAVQTRGVESLRSLALLQQPNQNPAGGPLEHIGDGNISSPQSPLQPIHTVRNVYLILCIQCLLQVQCILPVRMCMLYHTKPCA